ncbi:hypothetical protein RDV89_10400 [Nocardioides zeae]|uniref:Uncharacterized protein n=1 Tax=Nocardioides imazamoxiresistens TaxID=3231893 RepID=A0ABU3PW79_9ACTN|nr:hypothetical protein [Nocardioides zeae]MDT9593477.1 hypothetical protein [Nocardioides zeae]
MEDRHLTDRGRNVLRVLLAAVAAMPLLGLGLLLQGRGVVATAVAGVCLAGALVLVVVGAVQLTRSARAGGERLAVDPTEPVGVEARERV